MSGPLPRYVYWRRRLLLLAGAIALVWVGVQVIGRIGGGGSSKPPAASTASNSPTTAPANSPTSASAAQSASVSLTSAATACNPENVSTLAWVPTDQTAGKPVTIDLVFSTDVKGGCSLTSQAAQLVVVISSGGTAVYDSSVCKTSLLTDSVALSQGWATQVPVTWSGRGSGRDCSSNQAYASAGSYTVQVGTLGGNPGKASFSLAKAPKPSPGPSASTPTPSSSTSTPSSSTPTPSATSASPTPSTKMTGSPKR